MIGNHTKVTQFVLKCNEAGEARNRIGACIAKIFLAIKTKLHYIFPIAYAALILRILILPDNKD